MEGYAGSHGWWCRTVVCLTCLCYPLLGPPPSRSWGLLVAVSRMDGSYKGAIEVVEVVSVCRRHVLGPVECRRSCEPSSELGDVCCDCARSNRSGGTRYHIKEVGDDGTR